MLYFLEDIIQSNTIFSTMNSAKLHLQRNQYVHTNVHYYL